MVVDRRLAERSPRPIEAYLESTTGESGVNEYKPVRRRVAR
jgi:hypothetical protein